MPDLAQHFILRLEDDRVIAPTPAARRTLARVVLETGRPFRLFAFNGVDTHLHGGSACSGEAAIELARRIKLSLRRRLGLRVEFAPTRLKTIHDQHHLVRAFLYILRQHRHHAYGEDPFHDASILPDLLGLRLIGAETARLARSLLPRVRRSDLLEALGVDHLEPLDAAPLPSLPEAAAAAAGLPALIGRSSETVEARRAAVHAAGRRHPAAALAAVLSCAERTIKRHRAETPVPALVRAIQLQLSLRAVLPGREERLLAEPPISTSPCPPSSPARTTATAASPSAPRRSTTSS